MGTKRVQGWSSTISCALLVLLFSGTFAGANGSTVHAQQECRKVNSIDVCGRFLQEWSKLGSEQASVFVNGLPITARHPEVSLTDGKQYDTQWFERARYEAHPENKAPYDVLLGLLGTALVEGRGATDPATLKVRNAADQPFVGINKPSNVDGKTRVYFEQTRHSVSGKILDYWTKYGGLSQFGYPLSEQFSEVSPTDGKIYQVQYFERNRFEVHPEKQAPYEVELGLLGVQQYKTSPIPAERLPIAPPRNTASSKDTAVIGFAQEPAGLLGWEQDSAVGRSVIDALEDGLVGRDNQGNYYPEDAWYVPTLENGGSYFVGTGDDRHMVTKYKLRRGVKWSDGQELTSNDALFAYKLLTNPSTPVSDRTMWQELSSVDTLGNYTVIYNWLSYKEANNLLANAADKHDYAFLKPYVDARQPVSNPDYVSVGAIYPQHALKSIPVDTVGYSPYAHEGHIGTGPYKVERWLTGQELDLVQNENYTLTDKPLLKRVVIRFIGDPTQMLALLKAGQLDGATGDAFPSPVDGLDTLGSDQIVDYVPGLRWERADFDFGSPILQDRAVREAIITAINRQKIVDNTQRGKAVVLNTVVPPESPLSVQNSDFARRYGDKYKLPIYTYDVGKANSILDAAGWVKGPDGIRTKNNERLQLSYVTVGTNKPREAAAKLIQVDLKAVGIDLQVKKAPTPCADCPGQPCSLCAYGSAIDGSPDFAEWLSENAAADSVAKGRVVAYTRYSNPDLDAFLRVFAIEPNKEQRELLSAQIQARIMADVATVPLYVRPNIQVHRLALTNWTTSAGDVSPFYNVAQWYFR